MHMRLAETGLEKALQLFERPVSALLSSGQPSMG